MPYYASIHTLPGYGPVPGGSEEFAKFVANILKSKDIDAVSGLELRECVGRTALAVFRPVSSDPSLIMVGDPITGKIDLICNVSRERFEGSYYLYIDKPSLLAARDPSREFNDFYLESLPNKKPAVSRIAVYRPLDGEIRMEKVGEISYDVAAQSIDMSGMPIEWGAKIGGWRNNELDIVVPRGSACSCFRRPGDSTMLRNSSLLYLDLGVQSTGVVFSYSYGFSLSRDSVPNPHFADPLAERLIISLPEDRGWRNEFVDVGDCLDSSIAPLADELVAAYAQGIDLDDNRGYYDHMSLAYALVVTPAPKGCKRPIGHLIVKVGDDTAVESAEIAICRLTAKFAIEDVYIRIRESGHVNWRRCSGVSARRFKELIGDPKVFKDTLSNARNLHNTYTLAAAMDGLAAIPASKVRAVASLPFGAEFAEWMYRLGYTKVADQAVNKINSRRAWSGVDAMSDLFEGYDAAAKSPFECFGLPKSWGRAAFEIAQSRYGEDHKADVTLDNLINSVRSCRVAWDLEASLTGKPSEASIPNRAKEYAKVYFDISSRSPQVIQAAWDAFGDDIGPRTAFLRSFRRMLNKAAVAIPDKSAYSYEGYIRETFMAYADLKQIGKSPESLGIYAEYGLPENSSDSALDMIKRRCEAAQHTVDSYRDLIDAKKHADQEKEYSKRLKADKWLELKNKEGDDAEFEFYVPTSIYGPNSPLSIVGEAIRQNNCLKSYISRLIAGNYHIVLMRDAKNRNENLVTIGLTKDYILDQTYGRDDEPITSKEADAILEWVAKINAKGKGVIHNTRTPSGWAL